MLKANFTITESGGTGVVQLQSSADSGTTWQNVGQTLTLSGGALTVDDNTKLYIDTSVLIPGQSYHFRLADTSGTPVSDAVTYAIPTSSETLALTVGPYNDNKSMAFNLTAANGSGRYRLRAKGGVLSTDYVDQLDSTSAPADGSFLLGSLDIGGPHPYIYGITYTFQVVDIDTGVESPEVSYTTPAITGYATVEGAIGFANPSGGDNWEITFAAAPTAAQSLSGASVVSYDRQTTFISAGVESALDSKKGLTTDSLLTFSRGAGIYALGQEFIFSDGTGCRIFRIVRVDGSGTILGDIQYNGMTIRSTSGLDIDMTAHLVQTGVSEAPSIAATNAIYTTHTVLSASTSYTGQVPGTTAAIYLYTTFDATFWSDFPSYVFISPGIYSCGSMIIIS